VRECEQQPPVGASGRRRDRRRLRPRVQVAAIETSPSWRPAAGDELLLADSGALSLRRTTFGNVRHGRRPRSRPPSPTRPARVQVIAALETWSAVAAGIALAAAPRSPDAPCSWPASRFGYAPSAASTLSAHARRCSDGFADAQRFDVHFAPGAVHDPVVRRALSGRHRARNVARRLGPARAEYDRAVTNAPCAWPHEPAVRLSPTTATSALRWHRPDCRASGSLLDDVRGHDVQLSGDLAGRDEVSRLPCFGLDPITLDEYRRGNPVAQYGGYLNVAGHVVEPSDRIVERQPSRLVRHQAQDDARLRLTVLLEHERVRRSYRRYPVIV
jgi:hypothetical protein